jgi:hypothetical protein
MTEIGEEPTRPGIAGDGENGPVSGPYAVATGLDPREVAA